MTQLLNIFFLDAFFLLKLRVVQQNSPKCKNESDDTCQETSVYMNTELNLLFDNKANILCDYEEKVSARANS